MTYGYRECLRKGRVRRKAATQVHKPWLVEPAAGLCRFLNLFAYACLSWKFPFLLVPNHYLVFRADHLSIKFADRHKTFLTLSGAISWFFRQPFRDALIL